MLKIQNLKARLKNSGEEILSGVSLKIGKGELHVILGPNGSGKSTLGKVLLNHFSYEKIDGKISFNGEEISNLKTFEIAKKGVFLSHQHPISIDGISSFELIRAAQKEMGEHVSLFRFKRFVKEKFSHLGLSESFLEREFNKGFSGGEQKKMEIAQMQSVGAKLAFLDEIDSGLDFDALKLIANGISEFVSEGRSVILVTHSKEILKCLEPNFFHIFCHGKIIKSGGREVFVELEKKGYTGIAGARNCEGCALKGECA